MKKITLILLIISFFYCVSTNLCHADADYRAYEKITVYNGKLIHNWTQDEYKEYLTHVTKTKFSGWNIYTVTKNAKVVYDTETLFSYYNDGYTAINYSYSHKSTSTHKVSISATGTIGITKGTTKKEFKDGLTQNLKVDVSYTFTGTTEEKYSIDMKIDPGTKVDLYIHGEGKITNGVACRYVFFIKRQYGAYEIFTITTQYYKLEKIKI